MFTLIKYSRLGLHRENKYLYSGISLLKRTKATSFYDESVLRSMKNGKRRIEKN